MMRQPLVPVPARIAADSHASCSIRVRLRRHPFPVRAHLQNCLTLTFALPAHVLRRLLPPGLELETVDGRGFVAIALVQARSLRPAALPAALGQDFFLAGYRVFTTFRGPDGRTIRGLRILRSDADRRLMVAAGNLLTHYNYRLCKAAVETSAERMHVAIAADDGYGDLEATADLTRAVLPEDSPFASVRDARRFAGPLPYTFDYESETRSIVAINATRRHWQPRPVAVEVRRASFFDQPAFAGCVPRLAAAFYVNDVEYRWERGVRHPLRAPEAVWWRA